MNSIPSSKGTAVLVALVIAAAAVGTVAAVDTESTSAPEEAEVGDTISAQVVLSDVVEKGTDWDLQGSTELQNVSRWRVVRSYPNGTEQVDTFEDAEEFSMVISGSSNVDQISVNVTGDVPAVSEYTYRQPQKISAMTLTKDGGEEIEKLSVHHYTEESKQARQAIEDAEAAIEDADSPDAESDLQDAIDFYEGGEFDKAIDNAEEAESKATEASESQETMQLLLYGLGALVVLVLIGGGVYYYRNQQESYDKLR